MGNGNKTRYVAIIIFALRNFVPTQGKTVNTFSKSSLKSTGFTGVEVFNEKMEDIFKGTTAAESFLYITVMDSGGKI